MSPSFVAPIYSTPQPKAILHIDGDAFFASCEQMRNPALRGKPVITGAERGIAASMSYEAKNMGVTRAMPLWEIRKICPNVVVLPSDYEAYSILSERLYEIVRRYVGYFVEEYGIDECFAEIGGLDKVRCESYFEIAQKMSDDLRMELGFTFSIGVAPTKTLAKLGSKWKKPHGLTEITAENRFEFLDKTPIDKVWGVGPATTAKLQKRGVVTAGDFARLNEEWVRQNFARPGHDTWQELNGRSVLALALGERAKPKSVQKFKTFTPPSTEIGFVFSQLVKNIENACIKLRRHERLAGRVFIILRTQDFRHAYKEVVLPAPTNVPPEIIPYVKKEFKKLFKLNTKYRATGVTMWDFDPVSMQLDLFGGASEKAKFRRLYQAADVAASKFGKHAVYVGSSFLAQKFGAHVGQRGKVTERTNTLLKGETKRRRLGIPMLMGVVV